MAVHPPTAVAQPHAASRAALAGQEPTYYEAQIIKNCKIGRRGVIVSYLGC